MDAATATQARQVGASLVENEVITAAQLDQALQQQESTGERLDEILVAEFGVSQVDLSRALAEHPHDPVGTELRERLGLIPLQQTTVAQPLAAAEIRLRRPIGEIFVELGFITEDQLEGALAVQKQTGARIGEILVEQGILTRLDLASALAEHWESGRPAAAVAGPFAGNGVPVAPTLEPGRGVEADPPIVEPARPARRRWRRSRRSSAAEAIHSPTQAGQSAAFPATPGDLGGKIADLERMLASLEGVRVNDALASEARLAALEAAIGDLAGPDIRVREDIEQGRTDRPDALVSRLELLESKLEALGAAFEGRVEVLAAATVELGAELRALTDRPVGTEPGQQLTELAQRVESIETDGRERIGQLAEDLRADVQSRVAELASDLCAQQEESAALRVETSSFGARIDELQGLRHADVQAARAANEMFGKRLDMLAVARDGDADASLNTVRALEEAQALRAGLHDRLDRVEASLGQRLERIEESLAADDRTELSAMVAELGCRLDEQAAIGEERALSAAGKGPGQIERLGAAVVAADASMTERVPVPEGEGFVAFAPTAAGYRLIEVPGRPPEIGSTLELDVCDGPLVVTRYGSSPLPFDRRPCAYLGRD